MELKHATAQFAQASVSSNDKTVQRTLLTQFTKRKKKDLFHIIDRALDFSPVSATLVV